MKLPLIICQPGQPNAKAWVCSFCGSRYFGQLDSATGEDMRRNVRDPGIIQTNESQS